MVCFMKSVDGYMIVRMKFKMQIDSDAHFMWSYMAWILYDIILADHMTHVFHYFHKIIILFL